MFRYCARLIAYVLCAAVISACDMGPKSATGFRLPDGDPEVGKQLFVQLECNNCHTIVGLELSQAVQPGPVSVTLGGPVARVKTYGQLVSSVINPSHRIVRRFSKDLKGEESLMPIYNETMTIQQLIDLVAFLQVQYRVILPQYSYHSYNY